MFAWAPLPPALAHLGSLEFSKQLLTQAKVAVAPGVGYGENGEGFVRIAMVENEQRLRQAARNVRKYLQSMGVNTPSCWYNTLISDRVHTPDSIRVRFRTVRRAAARRDRAPACR
jgi:hypothetical protein